MHGKPAECITTCITGNAPVSNPRCNVFGHVPRRGNMATGAGWQCYRATIMALPRRGNRMSRNLGQ